MIKKFLWTSVAIFSLSNSVSAVPPGTFFVTNDLNPKGTPMTMRAYFTAGMTKDSVVKGHPTVLLGLISEEANKSNTVEISWPDGNRKLSTFVVANKTGDQSRSVSAGDWVSLHVKAFSSDNIHTCDLYGQVTEEDETVEDLTARLVPLGLLMKEDKTCQVIAVPK